MAVLVTVLKYASGRNNVYEADSFMSSVKHFHLTRRLVNTNVFIRETSRVTFLDMDVETLTELTTETTNRSVASMNGFKHTNRITVDVPDTTVTDHCRESPVAVVSASRDLVESCVCWECSSVLTHTVSLGSNDVMTLSSLESRQK